MFAGLLARTVEFMRKRAIENVVDQCAFARSADARDDGHDADREAGMKVLQVVAACAVDGDPLVRQGARIFAVQDAQLTAEIASRERGGRVHDLRRRSFCDHMAAQFACAGSEVENVIRVANCLFIVLDDEHGVAQVAQRFESRDRAADCRAGAVQWRARRARRERHEDASRSA